MDSSFTSPFYCISKYLNEAYIATDSAFPDHGQARLLKFAFKEFMCTEYFKGFGPRVLTSSELNEVTHGSEVVKHTYKDMLESSGSLKACHIANSPILAELDAIKGLPVLKNAADKLVKFAQDID